MKNLALCLLFVTSLASAQRARPLVFVDGNGSEREAARQTPHVRRDDQTMELARDLLKACPEISLTRNEESSDLDYTLLFNRGDEYGLFRVAQSQILLLDRDKNIVYSSKQGTVSRAAKDGCKAILADWKEQRVHTARNDHPAPVPKAEPKSQPNNLPQPVTDSWWKQQQAKAAEGDKQQ
jgi:hypothetical protein